MAREDFFGEYQVLTASGTDFGLDTLVRIEGLEDDDSIQVHFTLAGDGGSKTVPARYAASTDALELGSEDRTMVISRFVDPTPGSTYRSIYGIVIRPQDSGVRGRCPAWGATLRSSEERREQTTDTDLDPAAFSGPFQIRSTADTQFGIGSRVEIVEQTNGISTVHFFNALGIPLLYTTLTFDAGTCSIYALASGEISGPDGPELVPIIVSMSVVARKDEATGRERRYLYGNFALGDPEQGGTFAGEEDDPDTGTVDKA